MKKERNDLDELLDQAQESIKIAINNYGFIAQVEEEFGIPRPELYQYVCEKMLQLDPEDSSTNFCLGTFMLDKGDLKAAQQYYERLLELDENSAERLKEYIIEYLIEKEELDIRKFFNINNSSDNFPEFS
jgi:tetratricopeptide (TPR) repeat protein